MVTIPGLSMKTDETIHVKNSLHLSSQRSIRAVAYLFTTKYIYLTKVNSKCFIYFTKVNSKYFICFTYLLFSKSISKVPPPTQTFSMC